MQDALIPAIVMALISALGFIAYKHPKSYAAMYPVLAGIFLVTVLVLGAFSFGFQIGFSNAVLKTIDLNRSHNFQVNLPECPSIPFTDVIYIWATGAYLMILKFLPRLLDLPVEKDKEKKPEDN